MNRSSPLTSFLKRTEGFAPLVALLTGLALAHAACGTTTVTSDGGTTDGGVDAGFDAGPTSACGHPGDTGNDAGVGRYCLADGGACPLTAPICSALFNGSIPGALPTSFCVLPCNECDAPDFCGAGAACVCQSPGNCGCTPTSCSAIFPDAGNPACTTPDGGDGG